MAEMTLEEAFAAATVDVPAGMVDDVFVIDAPNRKIIVPDSETSFGVETDRNVERKYFRCPRIVGDNIDLYTHKIYVVYVFAKDARGTFQPEVVNGTYWCDDVAVDDNCITFSWQLSDNVLTRSGIIAFKILAATTENGLEKTRWNTIPAYGTVQMTVPDGDDIAERYPDIVTQLLERMDAVEKIATEEAMQRYVNEYLDEHPVQLDPTLTDNTKAAPADVVGGLKSDIGNLVSKNQGTENSGKALVIDDNGNVVCGEAGVSVDKTLSEDGKAADAKVVGEKISRVDDDLTMITGYRRITDIFLNKLIYTNGITVDVNEKISFDGYCCAVESCAEGDVFHITGKGASAGRLWCFIDGNGNVLTVSEANAIADDVRIVAPENAINVVFNSTIADSPLFVKGETIDEKICDINGKIEIISDKIDGMLGKLYLPIDENAPSVDFTIYKTANGFSTSKSKSITQNATAMYVNPVKGKNIDGYGYSRDKPFKYISYAIEKINASSNTDFIIYVNTDDGVMNAQGILQSETTITGKNIEIINAGKNKADLFASYWSELTWVSEDGVYKADTDVNVTSVISVDVKDEYGNYVPFTHVYSASSVKSTNNSWYKDGRNLYVNSIKTPTIENGYHLLYTASPQSINLQRSKIRLSGIRLYSACGIKNSSGYCDVLRVYGRTDTEVIIDNCAFCGAVYDISDGITSGAGIFIDHCQSYIENTHCAYNCGDGISYNARYWDINTCKNHPMTEINCIGYKNGDPDKTGTSNASTSHYAVNIIRAGCIGINCAGPMFADVGGARAINYECKAMSDYSNKHYAFNVGGGTNDGYLWLINCEAYTNFEKAYGIGYGSEGIAHGYVCGMKTFLSHDVADNSTLSGD